MRYSSWIEGELARLADPRPIPRHDTVVLRPAVAALCLLLAAAGQLSPQSSLPDHAAEARQQAQARIATTASLRTLENATADAAAETEALARRKADADARLQAHAKALEPLLPLIERLSLYPAETLLTLRGDPQTALTGLLVLKGLAHQLETEAEALRAEQAEVARLSAALAAQDQRLAAAQSAQAEKAAGLDQQIAAAPVPEDPAAAAARSAAAQARQAPTLRAALTQLDLARRQDEARARAEAAAAERQRQDALAAEARQREAALVQPAGPGLGEAHGQLGAPVAGAVVKAWGEPGDAGPATGISYSPPPAARVAAPCGGRVVFAGPFRSFGQLMIIDCGGGFHFVLAGLDRLDAPVGRSVAAGEPIGVMPSWDPHNPGNRPSLYLELRQNGLPINPAPYLRSRS